MRAPLRVVLADDSGFMRALVGRALSDEGFDVVGRATDGGEALELCRDLRPDVLTLDLAMPGLGGLDVLEQLGRAGGDVPPVPVVVVSAFSPADGARAVDALTAGAFDLVAKPSGGTPLREFARELADKVRAAAAAAAAAPSAGRTALARPAATRLPPRHPGGARPGRPASARRATPPHRGSRVLAIAASTGGPRALAALLPRLPAAPAGAVVVQHMPAGFTRSLAERLDRGCRLDVREAVDGDRLRPGLVLLAPGGHHLRFDPDGTARLSDEPPVGGLRPRADVTVGDLARLHGERLLFLVLTGMGRDGTDAAAEVRRAGGATWTEAEETCAVHGMPRAVVEAGLADRTLPLGELAAVTASALDPAREEALA